ncbi:hypothetical protein V1509DRAFT_637582 [Lipomyces kononenkoae]
MSTVISSSELDLKRSDSSLSTATTLADLKVPAPSHLTTSTSANLDNPTTATFAYDFNTDQERGKESELPLPKKILGLRAQIFWILSVSLFLVILVIILVVAILTRKSSADSSNASTLGGANSRPIDLQKGIN